MLDRKRNKKKRNEIIAHELSKDQDDGEFSDEEQANRYNQQSQGLSMEEFKKLKIPDSVMREGILFVWIEKELIQELIIHLESINFTYVENVCYLMLDREMEPGKLKMLTEFLQRSQA